MFRKNPLVEFELNYLRQNRPHQKRHYFLLALALIVASIPLFQAFTRKDEILVLGMAIVILSVYWFFQGRIMNTAVESINHALADEMFGNYSKRELLRAKLWAILLHYRRGILLISLAAFGLSLALMGYVHRLPNDILGPIGQSRHVAYPLSYVTIFSLITTWDYSNYPPLPHLVQVIIAITVLLSLCITNTILTICVGLSNSSKLRGLLNRLMLLGLIWLIFSGFFFIRNTFSDYDAGVYLSYQYCGDPRPYMTYDVNSSYCQDLFHERFFRQVVESIQAIGFSYLDGGIAVTTALLKTSPNGQDSIFAGYFVNAPFMWRHLIALIMTLFSQLGLSTFLLWRTSRGMGKKKK